jgi:hypothetical protein
MMQPFSKFSQSGAEIRVSSVLWDVAPCSLVDGYQRNQLRSPSEQKIEAAGSSKLLVTPIKLHGVTLEKTAVLSIHCCKNPRPEIKNHDDNFSGTCV